MFQVDGDFGKVRLASHLPTLEAQTYLSYFTAAGWHRCNDRYRLVRDTGLDTWLLFLTVEGRGHMRVDGVGYDLPGGSAAMIPAGAPHEYFVPGGGLWEFYWVHMGGEPAVRMLRYIAETFGAVVPLGEAAGELYRGAEDLLFMKKTGVDCFEARASRILTGMLHQIIIGVQEERERLRERDVVKRLMGYLETHYASAVSIREVSGTLYLSAAHLTRLFKAGTGFTPCEYLARYRMQTARELLLHTDLSVKEIAARTGFPHASHFISRFRAAEGVTPGDFRRRSGG